MEIAYAIVWHDHDPEVWRRWCGVHEIYTDCETGTRHWSQEPVVLVAHGQQGGATTLVAEVSRILAEVSGRPVLRTTELMAAGGKAIRTYDPAPSVQSAEVSARMAAE